MGSKEDYLWAKYIGGNDVLLGIYWKTHWELGKPIGEKKESQKCNISHPSQKKKIESIWMHVTILYWLNKLGSSPILA
jgi:hypothetical protein